MEGVGEQNLGRVNRVEPLWIPGVSRIFGNFRYDFFIGSLQGHTYPNAPYAHSEMISAQPFRDVQISAQRSILFGGKGHEPVTLHTFLKGFFSTTDTTATDDGTFRHTSPSNHPCTPCQEVLCTDTTPPHPPIDTYTSRSLRSLYRGRRFYSKRIHKRPLSVRNRKSAQCERTEETTPMATMARLHNTFPHTTLQRHPQEDPFTP